MKHFFALSLTILCVFPTFSQVKIINDSIIDSNGKYKFINNPKDKKSIYCEFYDTNNKLIFKSEFKTKLKEFDTQNFDYYFNNNELYLDGRYTEFYNNGDTLLTVNLKKGIKIGKQKKYRPDKSLEEEINILNSNDLEYNNYTKNGKKLIYFKIHNNKITGDEIYFYENGNIKLRISHFNDEIEDSLFEYYPNNKLKRKALYINDNPLWEICLSESNDTINCDPVYENVTFLNMQETIKEFTKMSTVSSYLKNNNINFTCIVDNNGTIASINFTNIQPEIKKLIHNWLINSTKWEPGKFSGVNVSSKIEFSLSDIDSIYYINRKPFSAELSNHGYAPAFILKAKNKYENDSTILIANNGIEPTFIMVEDMPTFNNKSSDYVREYIAQNLRYPLEAAKEGIQGRVYIQFTIGIKGEVKDVSVLRGVHPLLDNEAIRVIKSMPRWRPGFQKGKPVSVQFTFPVNFQLK